MSDNPEIKKNGEELAKTLTDMRSAIEEVGTIKEKMDSYDAEKITTMEAAVGELSQKHSDALAREKSMEDRCNKLEAEVSAQVANGKSGDEADLVSNRTKLAVADYLRKGTMIDDEAVNDIADGFASKMFTANENMIARVQKDWTVGSNPDGGYFITPERSSRILTRVFETSPLRGMATVTTTTSSSLEFVLDDEEVASGWVGEVNTRSDTASAQIGMIKIPIHEIFAQPKATQKMIDDAGFDMEGYISNKVSSHFSREENTAFVSGDGAERPKGFLTFAASADSDVYERGKIGQLETGTSLVIGGDDLLELQGKLKEDFQVNAQWGMKRSTWTTILQLKGADNQYLFNTIDTLAKGQPMVLLGRPVTLMDDMPAIATGALSVAYADWAEFYTIVDRLGIRVLRDPFTSKPFVRFYTTKRVGGSVTSFDAGKLLKIKA